MKYFLQLEGKMDEALKHFTDAILKNPHSANLYAKRARYSYDVYLYNM